MEKNPEPYNSDLQQSLEDIFLGIIIVSLTSTGLSLLFVNLLNTYYSPWTSSDLIDIIKIWICLFSGWLWFSHYWFYES